MCFQFSILAFFFAVYICVMGGEIIGIIIIIFFW